MMLMFERKNTRSQECALVACLSQQLDQGCHSSDRNGGSVPCSCFVYCLLITIMNAEVSIPHSTLSIFPLEPHKKGPCQFPGTSKFFSTVYYFLMFKFSYPYIIKPTIKLQDLSNKYQFSLLLVFLSLFWFQISRDSVCSLKIKCTKAIIFKAFFSSTCSAYQLFPKKSYLTHMVVFSMREIRLWENS